MIISDEDLLLELDKRFKACKNMLSEQEELSKELVLTNKKLMESEALKTHFISSITNEIINPFSSVLGLSRSILMVKENDWEKARNMARLIHAEAFSLDFQFRNIFAAANIEAGELFLESSKISIAELGNSVVDSFRHEAEKKNIQIELDFDLSDPFFVTDSDKLKLIFSNLLSNSIKYNCDNGKISIRLESSANILVFTISDTGIGISEQNKELIFDRFKRIDDHINSINRGHGLGLSIVKSLVELLGGTIQIDSDSQTGSEFIITIPESESTTSIYNFTDESDLGNTGNNEIF
jgi:signal transduction histidine kinase